MAPMFKLVILTLRLNSFKRKRMSRLKSKVERRGELVQFYLPFNGKCPVYLEVSLLTALQTRVSYSKCVDIG